MYCDYLIENYNRTSFIKLYEQKSDDDKMRTISFIHNKYLDYIYEIKEYDRHIPSLNANGFFSILLMNYGTLLYDKNQYIIEQLARNEILKNNMYGMGKVFHPIANGYQDGQHQNYAVREIAKIILSEPIEEDE